MQCSSLKSVSREEKRKEFESYSVLVAYAGHGTNERRRGGAADLPTTAADMKGPRPAGRTCPMFTLTDPQVSHIHSRVPCFY